MDAPTDVRLSEPELAALRRAMSVHSGREQRNHVRHLLPDAFTLVVRAHPANGAVQTFSASARDLSASGVGFYHTSYIHLGTPCSVLMRTLLNNAVAINGKAVRCRHVRGRIHEVGVGFDTEIEVGQFVQGTTVPVSGEPGFSGEAHAKAARLVLDLKALLDQRASRSVLTAKLGELALILAPEHTAPAPDDAGQIDPDAPSAQAA